MTNQTLVKINCFINSKITDMTKKQMQKQIEIKMNTQVKLLKYFKILSTFKAFKVCGI